MFLCLSLPDLLLAEPFACAKALVDKAGKKN
jgi:hypothetical protein